jgi:hypothetical protein
VWAIDTVTGMTSSLVSSWSIGAVDGNGVSMLTPGTQSGSVGTAVSLPVSASDSDPSQVLDYSAAGLPPGLRINPATGLISGTPAIAATSLVTVRATDTTGSVSFNWVIIG